MNRNNSEKGQALILIAFGIIVLIGFTALAIDGGRVFSDRRNAQNAADTAALAAALAQIRDDYGLVTAGYEQSGLDRADDNGYQNDTDSTVIVEFCDAAEDRGEPCTGLPAGANPAEYIRVVITSDVHMTFARVLGREFVTNRVEAISRVQGSVTSGVFDPSSGLYSVNGDESANDCFKVLGNADLKLHDTGIFVNCGGDNALSFGGSADIYMDANAQIVGCSDDDDFPIDGTGQIDCGADSQTVTKNTFAKVPTYDSPPNCTTVGSFNGTTLEPGVHAYYTISTTVVFKPGDHCFPNGINIKPSAVLTGYEGPDGVTGSASQPVRLLINNDVSLKSSGNDFDSIEFFMVNSDLDIDGTITADHFRFFGIGNSSFNLDAHAELTSVDAYIFSESGEIDFSAQANANMTAPPQDDTYGGLLIYMPWDNPNDFELNGGTNNTWKGTVLMPGAEVTYNGGSGFELYGQVIAWQFKINGGVGGDIYFSADFTYNPPDDPTIEFTK